MSKDKLTDYDSLASNNLDVGGISIAEGMLPSNVNNAMREQMSHLADFAAGTTGIDVLNLQDDDASHSIKIQAPASVTATTTFTLPDGDGSANQSLVTNGSGTLSFSTRLANVVEDTTPQLGGNLDTNGNDITFGDSDKAIFGAGSDLQIYSDGTNSRIEESGSGSFIIKGTQIIMQSAAGETLAYFTSDGAATLYHNNSAKLATTSVGIDVQGSVTATSFSGDGSGLTGVSAGGGTYKGENGEVNAGGGDIFRVHQKQLDTSVTIDGDENALCAGPLTLATGVTVTVTSGGTLVIA